MSPKSYELHLSLTWLSIKNLIKISFDSYQVIVLYFKEIHTELYTWKEVCVFL